MSNTGTNTGTANAPTIIAYHVRENGKKGYWIPIGAAWAHKDEKGFNLDIECMPLNGKIVLRIASEKK